MLYSHKGTDSAPIAASQPPSVPKIDEKVEEAAAAEAAGRHVNVWLEEGRLPLEVGTRYRVGVDIGSQKQDAAGGGKFQEPIWGDRQQLDLAIVLTGKGAQIEPAWQNAILPRYGNMPAIYFEVRPVLEGPLTLCLSIMLAKEMTLLEEFQITLDVVADSAEVCA